MFLDSVNDNIRLGHGRRPDHVKVAGNGRLSRHLPYLQIPNFQGPKTDRRF